MRTPTYSLVKLAILPGDHVYVLNENEKWEPVKVIKIKKQALVTESGEILFEDHGWLWRCLEP